jgi:hypothetical protein
MDPLHFLTGLIRAKMESTSTKQKWSGSTMKITTIGFDIAKTIFHLFAVNKTGRFVKKKQLKRKQVLA